MTAAGFKVSVVGRSVSTLGEGTAWWADRERLVTVDITEGLVRLLDLGGLDVRSEVDEVVRFDGEVSAAVPRAGGGMIVAVDHQLLAVDAAGRIERTWATETDRPDNRFNDCRCDPRGRLWAGTMSRTRTPGQAGLYRLADGRLDTVIADTTLSNGMGWSPDGTAMYFIDSTTYAIDCLDYDLDSGTVSNRRHWARIDPQDGLPDGLTVDREGGVWVALFGGGAVRRYDADGELTHHISLPVTNPTCPGFGGTDLATLYVTSARVKLTEEQLRAEPAGVLLALSTGFSGSPANAFAG